MNTNPISRKRRRHITILFSRKNKFALNLTKLKNYEQYLLFSFFFRLFKKKHRRFKNNFLFSLTIFPHSLLNLSFRMSKPVSAPHIPFPPDLSLSQIPEDKNDDKRDSLEKMADIANNILQKISEINETQRIHPKPASSNLLLFSSISIINTSLFYEETPEIMPFLFLRFFTFLTIFCAFHFLWNLGIPQKNRFFLNIIAISANFLTSTIIIQFTGYFLGSPLPELSIESHAKGFQKDTQSTVLALAIILMRNNVKIELLNVLISYFGFLLLSNMFINRFYLNCYFHSSYYIEIFAWYLFSIVGMRFLNSQHKMIYLEKQKKLDSVENETKKVLNILAQVQNSLQDNYDNLAPSTSSKADDLMRKLKFLKFQTLLNFKDNNKNLAQSNRPETLLISPTHKKKSTKGTHLFSPTFRKVSKTFVKKSNNIMENQKAILLQKLEAYDLAPGGENIKKDKRWTLTPEDVDDIMNGILSKPSIFWLPYFLNNKKEIDIKNMLPKETKDFLLSHFTENSAKGGFADDLSVIKQNKFELDLKFIDFNPLNDYLVNVCENWNYDVFLLQTLTNGNVVIEFGYCIFRKFQYFTILLIFYFVILLVF